jgi:hypothetical protein
MNCIALASFRHAHAKWPHEQPLDFFTPQCLMDRL